MARAVAGHVRAAPRCSKRGGGAVRSHVGAESGKARFRISTLGPSVSHVPVARPDACPRRWPRRHRNACRCGGSGEEALRNNAPRVHRRLARRLRRHWHDVVHDCQVRHAALLEVRPFWIAQAVHHLQRRPLEMPTRHTVERARRLGVPEPEWALCGHSSRVVTRSALPSDTGLQRHARTFCANQIAPATTPSAGC